jgi:inhibitor of cysteine peptidase
MSTGNSHRTKGGDQNKAIGEVTVSGPDHGRRIEVASDSRIVVRLPENPSTGYRWELEPPLETVLKLIRDSHQPPARSVPGAGGIRVFEFRARSAGSALIHLRLRRPWESERPHGVFEVTVCVRTSSGLGK